MPWDKSKYPKDWPQIRQRILDRAGNCCEWCGAPNGAIGYRDKDGHFWPLGPTESEAMALDGYKVIRIVLTIAHVNDPDPMNVSDENLAALCQRCHNRHDAKMRQEHAAETRRQNYERTSGQLVFAVEENL